MIKFIKHYALEIYTVLAMAFIVYTAMLGELSFIQKLVVFDAFLFILHEWEEGHYPGGFVNMITELIGVEVSEETKRASRIPAGILLLMLSIIPFVFDNVPLVTMAVATFGIIEGFVHTIGIRLFRTKRFYTPGMVTAWLELVVSGLMIAYLVTNQLGQWYDYLFGPIVMLLCFGTLQKTMTLMVGINYGDMPKMIRRQWKRKADC
ncbi:MAG: HXXEE domain-containing protein [Bacteroidaceae bacterium]|nr:HXXEE domain-containing protein [Bacteroidaceae bacterium]